MKHQLHEIDRRLFDSQLRKSGTTSVLLYGAAGAGKTHLARQYVYSNLSKFKGGVFWINARFRTAMIKDLWQIAQEYVAKDSPEIRIAPNGLPNNYVAAVNQWFRSRSDWLIIFDGVAVESRQDAIDFQQIVPDSKNSSVIYTSRSSQLHASQRLMHPHPIRVPRLSDEDGASLIFQEVKIRKTKHSDKAARELSHKVSGLPLALHAISVRLAETHEPLEKYNPKYFAEDSKLGMPYNEILQGLSDNHPAAYTLMNLLAFFGPEIPVELLHLGEGALYQKGIEIRSSESFDPIALDINISFKVLLNHALIERNELSDSESAISSPSSLTELVQYDTIRLHTIIQKFCRDRLNSRGQFLQWLALAARVLVLSYREASRKIKERENAESIEDRHPARQGDYFEYLHHAMAMQGYANEHGQRNQALQDLADELQKIVLEIEEERRSREALASQESVIRYHDAVSIFDRTGSSSSDDGPITPGRERPSLPPLPGESIWGTPDDGILQTSPTGDRHHSAPADLRGRAQKRRPTALELLRGISTDSPEVAIEDDRDGLQEPHHIRADSRPEFIGAGSILPAQSSPFAQVHNETVFGSMSSSPMSRDGSLSGSSRAIAGLAEVYRNSPPPARGGGFVGSRRSSPAAKNAFSPPPLYQNVSSSPPSRPGYGRIMTGQTMAAPVITRNSPDPTAQPFYPRGYFNQSAPTDPYVGTWMPNQPLELMVPQHLSSHYAPPSYQPGHPWEQRQLRASLPSNMPSVGDSNMQATALNGVAVSSGSLFVSPQHHRASSVPNVGVHQTRAPYSLYPATQQALPTTETAVPSGHFGDMSRQSSSQSGSSGSSGTTAIRQPIPQSVPPQFISPWTSAPIPIANIPGTTSPRRALQQASSPLQNVMNVDQAHLNRGISPLPITRQESVPHSSPSPVGQSAYTTPPQLPSQYMWDAGIHSAPQTALIAPPPSATTSFAPSPLALQGPASVPLPRYSSALSSTSSPPLSSSPPFVADAAAMSRSSSGGPGIVVADPSLGLGIAEFGRPGVNHAAADFVTFGDHEPISILEGRRRSQIQEQILRGEEQARILRRARNMGIVPADLSAINRADFTANGLEWGVQSDVLPGGFRPAGATDTIQGPWVLRPQVAAMVGNSVSPVPSITAPSPYPPVNLIPSVSDQQALNLMASQAAAMSPSHMELQAAQQVQPAQTNVNRVRGFSEPMKDGWTPPNQNPTLQQQQQWAGVNL